MQIMQIKNNLDIIEENEKINNQYLKIIDLINLKEYLNDNNINDVEILQEFDSLYYSQLKIGSVTLDFK